MKLEIKKKAKGKRPTDRNGVPMKKPSLSDEEKRLKHLGKSKAIIACYNAFFNEQVNVDDLANDQTKTAIDRGFARMAQKFLENGTKDIAELVCGINGVSTKAKEVDHTVNAGTYTDFLHELAKKNLPKK